MSCYQEHISFIMHALVLFSIDLHTKSEMPSFTCSENDWQMGPMTATTFIKG